MAARSIAFRVLRHFPGAVPGGNCSPSELRARIIAKQQALIDAQNDATARTMQPDMPPVVDPPYPVAVARPSLDTSRSPDTRAPIRRGPPTQRGRVMPDVPGLPPELLEELLRSGGGRKTGFDLASAVRQLVDALYDNAIISNPDTLAFSASPSKLIITPGTPLKAADNNSSDRPLFVRIKGEVDVNGTKTFLYAAPYSLSTGQPAGSTIAKYDVGPVIDVVLNGANTVYVDGTAPAGQATFTAIVTSFYLNGRRTIYTR